MSDTLVTVTLFSPAEGAEDRITEGHNYDWTAHRFRDSEGEEVVTATTIIGGNCGPLTLAHSALADLKEAFDYENFENAARLVSVGAQPYDENEPREASTSGAQTTKE